MPESSLSVSKFTPFTTDKSLIFKRIDVTSDSAANRR